MLISILTMAGEGQVISIGDISCRLDISDVFAEQLIRQLFRSGYLRSVAAISSASGGCRDCSSDRKCGFRKNGIKMWELTDKGRKVIGN